MVSATWCAKGSPVLTVTVGSALDVGLHRRVQEDSAHAGSRLFVVADGMGGHAAGDVASRLVIDALVQLESQIGIGPEDVRQAILRANEDIVSHASSHPDCAGMGSTVAGVAIVSMYGAEHVAVFNVGDSRVYRQVDGELERATTDHSEVQELVDRGVITEGEARVHADRNIVTRSLGTRPPPVVDLWMMPPVGGERFLVCTDGLTSELDDTQIRSALSGTEPAIVASDLVGRANAAGGHDNIAVLVVDITVDDTWQTADRTAPRSIIEE